jgi:tRNA nucleotidyltransferase/poly(A) polymerase
MELSHFLLNWVEWRGRGLVGRLGPREFAVEIVTVLRQQGYQALLAGGCVRDLLLGKTPKDYDVATDAHPEEVLRLFPRRKTLEVGKAFGVIVVVGPRSAGSVEVATFRQDAGYSDGRRPDSVRFCSAEEDALRRDFTINGLFLDPFTEEVLDYVGGKEDLQRRCIRAIGDPHLRFREDKLRILRAVRFATVLGFDLDPQTRAAVYSDRQSVLGVSAERIGGEMRRLLGSERRAIGMQLLYQTGLIEVLLPELSAFGYDQTISNRCLAILADAAITEFSTTLAAIQTAFHLGPPNIPEDDSLIHRLAARWRLSSAEEKRAQWISRGLPVVRKSSQDIWPALQRLWIEEGADELLALASAFAKFDRDPPEHLAFARRQAALPPEQLNPAPVITGDDLLALGLQPSPHFARILTEIRDRQLQGKLVDRQQALDWARTTIENLSPPPKDARQDMEDGK